MRSHCSPHFSSFLALTVVSKLQLTKSKRRVRADSTQLLGSKNTFSHQKKSVRLSSCCPSLLGPGDSQQSSSIHCTLRSWLVHLLASLRLSVNNRNGRKYEFLFLSPWSRVFKGSRNLPRVAARQTSPLNHKLKQTERSSFFFSDPSYYQSN